MHSKLSFNFSKPYLAFLLLLALVFLPGCQSDRGLFVEERQIREVVQTLPAQTNLVPVVTNSVLIVDGKPTVREWTNYVEVIRPELSVTNLTTNIVFVPNPSVTRTISTIKTANETLNPMPWANVLTGALGLASAALGWIARLKTQKANHALTMLSAVVSGVEASRMPEVKESVSKVAKGFGVEDKLREFVKART